MAKLATLITEFDTLPLSLTTFGTVVVEDGHVDATAIAGYSGVQTTTTDWDLEDSFVFTRLSAVPEAGAGTTQALLTLRFDAANQVRMGYEGGFLIGQRVTTGPTFTTVFSTTYSSTDHQWLRISESGGTVDLASSTDGTDWFTQGSFLTSVLTSSITSYLLQLRTGFFGEEGALDPDFARWELINDPLIHELDAHAPTVSAAFGFFAVSRPLDGYAPSVAAGFGDLTVDTPVDFDGYAPSAAAAFADLTRSRGLDGYAPAAAAALGDLTVLLGPRDMTVTIGPSRLGWTVGATRGGITAAVSATGSEAG